MVSSLWSLSPLNNLLRLDPETLPRPPRTTLLAQVDVKSLGAAAVPTFHPATFPYFCPWNSFVTTLHLLPPLQGLVYTLRSDKPQERPASSASSKKKRVSSSPE